MTEYKPRFKFFEGEGEHQYATRPLKVGDLFYWLGDSKNNRFICIEAEWEQTDIVPGLNEYEIDRLKNTYFRTYSLRDNKIMTHRLDPSFCYHLVGETE